MKPFTRVTLSGAAASLACLATAQASVPHSSASGIELQDEKRQPDSPTTARASKQAPSVCLSRDLLGRDVKNSADENIGKVEDLVIQPNGAISYAVLSFGGVMGVGEKLFAIPWGVVHSADVDASTKRANAPLILAIDKERLKNAPGFDKKNWPSLTAVDWTGEVDTYYAKDRVPVVTTPVDASARKASLLRASELKGFNVQTPKGEKLGDIDDVAIDVHGHVSYAVVSAGGFLGMGDTMVAVPWEALQITREGDKKKIVLPTTKERLEKAPQFSRAKDKAAQMCDPNWIGSVYDYYSVRPYWSQDRELPKSP